MTKNLAPIFLYLPPTLPHFTRNGVALSRCDASVQLPFMLDFGSPAALFSTSPAHALPSPMVFPPCDAVKFSAKVTVAASLSPGVNTFKEPSTPMMLSPCGQLLGTPCGGWDQAEKLEWGAQWAAEDKLVTFAPGTVGASIQRAAEKIGSPALDHLDQACEFCEGNEAGPQCKGSEISDSEGEGEADPGSVAPPEKASDDHMISVPVRPGGQSEEMQRVGMRPKCKFCLRSFISQHAVDVHLTRNQVCRRQNQARKMKRKIDSFKALSVSYSTTTTSSKSSSKARWKMKTAGMKTGHGRKWCIKCSAVHHYKTSCGKCKGELDAKGAATPPLPPPSAAATSELRRKRAREGEKVTASPAPFAAATSELRQSMHAHTQRVNLRVLRCLKVTHSRRCPVCVHPPSLLP